MDFPYITFHTNGGSIRWTEGYAAVTDGDLDILLQQTRDALASLELEIERRQLRTRSAQIDQDDGCRAKLRKTAERLNILERLDDRASKHVKTAVEVLRNPQTNRAFKIYQEFLHDVLCHCGPGLVLLCAAGLGKQRIANMTAENRVSLLNHLKEKKDSTSSSTLEALAKDHEIPQRNSPKIAHISARHSKRQGDEIQEAENPSQVKIQNQDSIAIPAGRPSNNEMEMAQSSNQPRKRRHIADEHVPDTEQLPTAQGEELGVRDMVTGRQIQYMFSKAPTSHIHFLGDHLSDAVQTSNQWRMERTLGESTTECLTTLIPRGEDEDVSITLWVGQEEAARVIDVFKLQRTWSALPNHLSL